MMLVAEVALGDVFHTTKRDETLTRPPVGFDSVHGVSSEASSAHSDFEDDEFVVYDTRQQRVRCVSTATVPYD